MQKYAYLAVLIFSISGLMVADYKYKLAWFWSAKITAICLLATLVFFLAWDITGITLGVFSTNQAWVTGWYIGIPDLPIEEFLFLTLLGYQAILYWRWLCLRTS